MKFNPTSLFEAYANSAAKVLNWDVYVRSVDDLTGAISGNTPVWTKVTDYIIDIPDTETAIEYEVGQFITNNISLEGFDIEWWNDNIFSLTGNYLECKVEMTLGLSRSSTASDIVIPFAGIIDTDTKVYDEENDSVSFDVFSWDDIGNRMIAENTTIQNKVFNILGSGLTGIASTTIQGLYYITTSPVISGFNTFCNVGTHTISYTYLSGIKRIKLDDGAEVVLVEQGTIGWTSNSYTLYNQKKTEGLIIYVNRNILPLINATDTFVVKTKGEVLPWQWNSFRSTENILQDMYESIGLTKFTSENLSFPTAKGVHKVSFVDTITNAGIFGPVCESDSGSNVFYGVENILYRHVVSASNVSIVSLTTLPTGHNIRKIIHSKRTVNTPHSDLWIISSSGNDVLSRGPSAWFCSVYKLSDESFISPTQIYTQSPTGYTGGLPASPPTVTYSLADGFQQQTFKQPFFNPESVQLIDYVYGTVPLTGIAYGILYVGGSKVASDSAYVNSTGTVLGRKSAINKLTYSGTTFTEATLLSVSQILTTTAFDDIPTLSSWGTHLISRSSFKISEPEFAFSIAVLREFIGSNGSLTQSQGTFQFGMAKIACGPAGIFTFTGYSTVPKTHMFDKMWYDSHIGVLWYSPLYDNGALVFSHQYDAVNNDKKVFLTTVSAQNLGSTATSTVLTSFTGGIVSNLFGTPDIFGANPRNIVFFNSENGNLQSITANNDFLLSSPYYYSAKKTLVDKGLYVAPFGIARNTTSDGSQYGINSFGTIFKYSNNFTFFVKYADFTDRTIKDSINELLKAYNLISFVDVNKNVSIKMRTLLNGVVNSTTSCLTATEANVSQVSTDYNTIGEIEYVDFSGSDDMTANYNGTEWGTQVLSDVKKLQAGNVYCAGELVEDMAYYFYQAFKNKKAIYSLIIPAHPMFCFEPGDKCKIELADTKQKIVVEGMIYRTVYQKDGTLMVEVYV